MSTIWSATCHDQSDDVAVTVRVEATTTAGYDLHIHFPPPPRRPDLGPHDILLRALTWDEVLTWFARYRDRHRWDTPAPPSRPPGRPRAGHHRSARGERPRRTFARTLPWGRALSPLTCGAE